MLALVVLIWGGLGAPIARLSLAIPAPIVRPASGPCDLEGNAGTVPPLNFLGTIDNQSLIFETNGKETMLIDRVGRVGIGTASPQQNLSVNGAVNLDQANQNSGGVNPGITFGANSGEGIASQRTSGGNQFGLDFYTAFTPRLSIGQFGSVGIGTAPLNAQLTVNNTATGFGLLATDLFLGQVGGRNVVRFDNAGKGIFDGGTQTGGADFAESVRTTDDPASLQPGDVIVIDRQNPRAVKKSSEANSPLVAGVYSTKPSMLAIGDHHIDDSLKGEVPVAVVGIVPVKVTTENGPIAIGDMLVTSSVAGYAMKAAELKIGTILGKALEPLETGTGVIQVLVMLR
jgi:hypothetical protein